MLTLVTTGQAAELVKSFNWYSPSWDLFIFLFWAGAAVFYAFTSGRGRIVNLLFSLYISKLLILEAPWLTGGLNYKLSGSLSGLQHLISFLIVFIILFVLLGRYAFRTSADGRHFGSIPFSVIFAILQIGLLLNIVLTYLAEAGRTFSPLVKLIFLGQTMNFIWLVLPLIFLIILGRAVADPTEI